MVRFMEENSTYAKHQGNFYELWKIFFRRNVPFRLNYAWNLRMWRMRTLASISITRTYHAKWKSRKYKITCNRQFSSPLSCLLTVDSFFRATKYNQGRVALIYSLWGCTGVPIFLGPETEVKRITSEITQSRRANLVSTYQEVPESRFEYIF